MEKKFTYETIIEVNDPSKDFIPYWNLAMKENLSNNFATVELDPNKNGTISFNSFNFKLINIKEPSDNINNDIIQLDKLFQIDVYRIRKEKDFNNDYIKLMRQNYNINNLNVVLYNIDDVKDNQIKNISKIIDKVKSKAGLVDFSFIPYNEQNYTKFYSIIDNFFVNMKKKITAEYTNQLTTLLDKIKNIKDIYNSEDPEIVNEFIKNKILYLDLLTIGEFWEDIKEVCNQDLYKIFVQLKNKFIFTDCSSDINILETKKKVKNKNITNIEYQIYLINYYMKSCIHLKDYNGLIQILFDSSRDLKIYKDFFESEYHYFYWIINFILNLINFLINFEEKISGIVANDIDNKACIKQGILFLYTICIKYFREYAKVLKYEIPSLNFFMKIKSMVDKGLNVKEELEKILNDNNFDEKSEIFIKFKNDIKAIDKFYFDLNKNIFDIFTNKRSFLEEYVHLLQLINKKNCELLHRDNSIRNVFEIIPILISLNQFDEAKNKLNVLLQDKIFIKLKLNCLQEFICLIFVMILYSSEKHDDNLKLMLKLLDTKYSNMKYFLNKLGCKEENLINDIINKFLEAYSNKDNKPNKEDINEKINKIFSLDKVINIILEKKNDNIIFFNKQKTNKEQIKYSLTNNTGISFNINKIQLIFEELSFRNDNNNDKNEIIYEINEHSNNLKSIEPYIKSQENIFEISLDENSNIFKINTTYKFKKIKYIINNCLCGIYNIKEELKICFNSIEMKVSTQIFPSYDTPEFPPSSKNVFYFNTLSKIDLNLMDIPDNDLLNNKILKINFEDMNKKVDNKLVIQTYLLQEKLLKEFPDIIIKDYSIEFPPNSLKEKDKKKINILIPFFIENINFYDNGKISLRIKVEIIGQNEEDKNKIYYSFSSFHNINLIHLFNIRKKFRIINNNSILMQTTFSLNIEMTNLVIYTHNSDNCSFYMDTSQAINLVLLLGDKENDIIKKLRQNFLEFSLEEVINDKKKIIKYRLCYPEKNILDEIKELKEIPYYISIDVDDINNDIFKELSLNIKIKKNNKKKVILLIHICDNENWAVIGKSKLIEEWSNDKDNNEKNLKVKLLPLVDGFLKLPEIEFLEYEIAENKDDSILKINENENKGEFTVGKINFDPIEYGTIIEGNEKVVNITPAKECTLKINLT